MKANQVSFESVPFFEYNSLQLTLIKKIDQGREADEVVYEPKTNCGSKLQVDFMKFICFVRGKLNADRHKWTVGGKWGGFSLFLHEKFNIT